MADLEHQVNDDQQGQGGTVVEQPIVPVQEQDPDDVLLAEAEGIIAAGGEGEGDGTGESGDQQGAGGDVAAAPVKPVAKPAGDQGHMVPIGRLNEEVQRRRQSDEAAAYHRGVSETLIKLFGKDRAENFLRAEGGDQGGAGGGQPGAGGAKPAAATEPTLEELYAAQDALAVEWDAGDMSMADFTKKSRELNNKVSQAQMRQVVEEQASQRRDQPRTIDENAAVVPQENTLAARTASIAEEYPILSAFVNDAETVQDTTRLAMRRFNMSGTKYDARNPMHVLQLRRDVAELIEANFGWQHPDLVQEGQTIRQQRATARGQQPGGRQPAAATVRNANAAAAANGGARPNGQVVRPGQTPVQRKLATAAGMPPDVMSAAAGGEVDQTEYSDERLGQMTEDQIALLPRSVQNRLLGIG